MLGKVKCIVGGQGQAAAKSAARQNDLPAKRFNLLCGSVAVDLALPLPTTSLDSELDGLALDDGLDIRARHFEGCVVCCGFRNESEPRRVKWCESSKTCR